MGLHHPYVTLNILCKAESREAATVKTFKAEQKAKPQQKGEGTVTILGEWLWKEQQLNGDLQQTSFPRYHPLTILPEGRAEFQFGNKTLLGSRSSSNSAASYLGEKTNHPSVKPALPLSPSSKLI